MKTKIVTILECRLVPQDGFWFDCSDDYQVWIGLEELTKWYNDCKYGDSAPYYDREQREALVRMGFLHGASDWLLTDNVEDFLNNIIGDKSGDNNIRLKPETE